MKRWEKPGIYYINKHFLRDPYRKWIRALIIELDAAEKEVKLQTQIAEWQSTHYWNWG